MKPSTFTRIPVGKFLVLNILLLLPFLDVRAQSYLDLPKINSNQTETYYSENAKNRAANIAFLFDKVIAFYEPILDFSPKVTLLVLSPEDWVKHTKFPVYGMPHYIDGETLVIASEDNDFWKSFIPPLEKLPKTLADEISRVYINPDGSLTMKGFFDLLAIHELGHSYQIQAKLNPQRKWMEELFSNIFLHTYIAEKEPKMLPALTIFPDMVVLTIKSENLSYSSLNDLENNYDKITTEYPKNYGWYQCRLHVAAGKIYDAAGISAFENLWKELKKEQEPLDDKALTSMLAEKVHPAVAEVPLSWAE
ncbi:hypothetical protein ML462_03540 [Gramella lutea]|uniref:Uncharacterized protein n=1 Tax=Christiangramia lutea TaxID=1607951 RepID=A0A9X2AA04_9FLAO|nr:hypothetical protein [Christiangramia lutea]MCH4822237.1 hypothetical protein [Christiangramia lutea]